VCSHLRKLERHALSREVVLLNPSCAFQLFHLPVVYDCVRGRLPHSARTDSKNPKGDNVSARRTVIRGGLYLLDPRAKSVTSFRCQGETAGVGIPDTLVMSGTLVILHRSY
jgi:hypothetical protein